MSVSSSFVSFISGSLLGERLSMVSSRCDKSRSVAPALQLARLGKQQWSEQALRRVAKPYDRIRRSTTTEGLVVHRYGAHHAT
jgi:hypothetical protein